MILPLFGVPAAKLPSMEEAGKFMTAFLKNLGMASGFACK